MNLADVQKTYQGSDGAATRRLYGDLEALGSVGHVAVNLLRACKCSERAKLYKRGPGYITEAYARKDWSVGNLARLLMESPVLPWGWGFDDRLRQRGDPHHHVLYVETPFGQVSFHTGTRGPGPDHSRPWDQALGSAPNRVCRWAALLLGDPDVKIPEPEVVDRLAQAATLDVYLERQGDLFG